jgi:hypothetical protein
MPKIWKKGEYKRLSVDRDFLAWCGWPKFSELLSQIETPLTRDLVVTAFSTMGRINEVLSLRSEMFDVNSNRILVTGMPVEKRWKKLGTELICTRCKQISNIYETVCKNCGANLIASGKKHFLTEKIKMVRIPFWFPAKEPQTPLLIDRIKIHEGLLFPELNRPDRGERYGRSMSYIRMREIDEPVKTILKVPHAWNHLWVAVRGHCIGEEYDMDLLEIQNFSTRVKAETVGKYVKKRLSYAHKMGIET